MMADKLIGSIFNVAALFKVGCVLEYRLINRAVFSVEYSLFLDKVFWLCRA